LALNSRRLIFRPATFGCAIYCLPIEEGRVNADDTSEPDPDSASPESQPKKSPDETVPPTIKGPPSPLAHSGAKTPPSGARPRFSRSGSERTSLPLPRADLSAEKVLRDVPRAEWEGGECPVLGGIPLLAKLGEGGMGSVYFGIHPRLNAAVAVKVLPVHLADQDPHLIARFIREAQIAARVHSPHLIHVIDVNYDAGLYYLVMEYVHGLTAGKLLIELHREGRSVSQLDAVDICIGACTGLLAAHQEGIIHRDIKPDNIMIPRAGASQELDCRGAKLMDLGLARVPLGPEGTAGLTLIETALGTPGFMPPEQVLDARTADTRSDIFSIGATLYALVCGRAPFVRESAMKALFATLNEAHTPMREYYKGVAGPIVAIVNRCLAKERHDRYPDTRALIEDLIACRKIVFQRELEGAAPPPPIITIPQRPQTGRAPVRKHRFLLPGLLAAAAVLLAIASAYLVFNARNTSSRGTPVAQAPAALGAGSASATGSPAVPAAPSAAAEQRRLQEEENRAQQEQRRLAEQERLAREEQQRAEAEQQRAAEARRAQEEQRRAQEQERLRQEEQRRAAAAAAEEAKRRAERAAEQRRIASEAEQRRRTQFDALLNDTDQLLAAENSAAAAAKLAAASELYPDEPGIAERRDHLARLNAKLEERRQVTAYLATTDQIIERDGNLDEAQTALNSASKLNADKQQVAQRAEKITQMRNARARRQAFSAAIQNAEQAIERNDLVVADKQLAAAQSLDAKDPQIKALSDKIAAKRQALQAAQAEQLRRTDFERHVKTADAELTRHVDLNAAEREIREATKLFPKDPRLQALTKRLEQWREAILLANQNAARQQAERERAAREERFETRYQPTPPPERERPSGRNYGNVGERMLNED
jgi:serine/threonine protein kinase